jgi:uncharacterized protein
MAYQTARCDNQAPVELVIPVTYISQLLTELWTVTAQMAPYLLFGFAVAGLLSVLLPPRFVERHLGGRGLWPVTKAALLGVPLPLCSCGVIPVSASLRRHGASRGATTAFLISTPQTGVDSIAVTLSLMGPLVAIYRPLAALVTGVIGGGIVDAVEHARGDDQGNATAATNGQGAAEAGHPALRALQYGFVTLPQDIAKSLLLGILISGVIGLLIPEDFFAHSLVGGFLGFFVMMLIGIPMYVCATASVPIAAAFIAAGISPGAALVFLITGPATNAATITTIWKVMGRRTALIYLGTIAIGALLSGLLLDKLITVTNTAQQVHHHHEALAWWHVASALLLVAVIINALWPRQQSAACASTSATQGANMGDVATILVKGMNCNHCVKSVHDALASQPGVESVQVDLAGGKAQVLGHGFALPALLSAVESLGYTAALQ